MTSAVIRGIFALSSHIGTKPDITEVGRWLTLCLYVCVYLYLLVHVVSDTGHKVW